MRCPASSSYYRSTTVEDLWHGWTGGFDSFISPYRSAGSWIGPGGVQADKTGASVTELLKELSFLTGEKSISEQELRQVWTNLVRAHAQQFQFSHQVAARLGEFWAAEGDPAERQQVPSLLNGVTMLSLQCRSGVPVLIH